MVDFILSLRGATSRSLIFDKVARAWVWSLFLLPSSCFFVLRSFLFLGLLSLLFLRALTSQRKCCFLIRYQQVGTWVFKKGRHFHTRVFGYFSKLLFSAGNWRDEKRVSYYFFFLQRHPQLFAWLFIFWNFAFVVVKNHYRWLFGNLISALLTRSIKSKGKTSKLRRIQLFFFIRENCWAISSFETSRSDFSDNGGLFFLFEAFYFIQVKKRNTNDFVALDYFNHLVCRFAFVSLWLLFSQLR